MGAGPKTGPTDPTGRSSGRDHSPFNGWASGDRNITFAVANDLFRKLSEGLAWLRRPCGAREPPALTLVCSKTARAVEWRDFSFTSKTAARFKEEEGEKDPNLETARAHAAKIASELAKETSYEGFAVSVTDEQGNEVAYVPIGEAVN